MTMLVMGGHARLARRLVAAVGDARTVVRRGVTDDVTVVVDDYAAIPPAAFSGVDAVVNCVGSAVGTAADLDRVNHHVAVAAARRARDAGVGRFVQVGSLSVYGAATWIDGATAVAPTSAYGRSKAAADVDLLALASDAFAVTILRFPALYGPGAAGKFGALAAAMRRLGAFPVPRPLPRRSVLHLDNAAAAIAAVCARPPVTGVLFAADRALFDFAALSDALATVDGRRPRLVGVPRAFVAALGALRPAWHASLFGDSVIDPAAAMTTSMMLPVRLDDGLAAMLAGGRAAT